VDLTIAQVVSGTAPFLCSSAARAGGTVDAEPYVRPGRKLYGADNEARVASSA
jgi:hypothetical protein